VFQRNLYRQNPAQLLKPCPQHGGRDSPRFERRAGPTNLLGKKIRPAGGDRDGQILNAGD
jgi:hypothetical protein